jgi:S1-C subfamily serine protease
MPRFLLPALALLSLAPPARSQDAISPETLAAVKKATVFIRLEAAGWSATGTGFVVADDGKAVLIATNDHVASARPPAGRTAVVTVVFESGTKVERSYSAQVVASDAERDLAVLRVTGVKDAPRPIAYADPPQVSETTGVYTLGFPFGKALAVAGGSPAITVGKASISSLRQGPDGELAVVQLDGSLNPGNSGGPVVDAKGRLVGVAVATIRDGQGIGFAVPTRELGKLMQGRVGRVRVTTRKAPTGGVTVRIEADLLDPAARLRGAVAHYLLVPSKGKVADGALDTDPGRKRLDMKLDKGVVSAEFDAPTAEGSVLVRVTAGADKDATSSATRTFAFAPPAKPADIVPAPRGNDPTVIAGGNNPLFKDAAPAGGLLIGVEFGLGKFGPHDVIHSARPIYRVGEKEQFGARRGTLAPSVTLKAKAGYAVGAMTCKSGLNFDGCSFTFMRVKADGTLDPKDSYESDWCGYSAPKRAAIIGGDGKPVVGVVGRAGDTTLNGFGLVFKGQEGFKADDRGGKAIGLGPEPFILGSIEHDPKFKTVGPDGGVLIGVEVRFAKFGGTYIARAVRPIYRANGTESFGQQFGDDLTGAVTMKAKAGYAVGGVTGKAGWWCNGFSLTFMKVMPDGTLDPKDSYEGEWAGFNGKADVFTVTSDGRPVVGIVGKIVGTETTAFGLLFKGQEAFDPGVKK